MNIFWIASYPKSGNTLLRLLLYSYLYGEPTDTNQLSERIPDLHVLMATGEKLDVSSTETKPVKTHLAWSSRHPYAEHTAGLIYVARHPCDVMISNARYLGADETPHLRRQFAELFIREGGVPRWRQQGMGTIIEHADSWLSNTADLPHVVVRYEDLRTDGERELSRILQLLGVEADADRVRFAVEQSSLERTREREIAERAAGRNRVFPELPRAGMFVGDGRIGQSLDNYAPNAAQRFEDRFGAYMRRFEYS